MSAQIIRGDARTLPLTDNSVDLIVTSPPYFGLRSYQDNGVHYSGQLGDEATPAEFVDALIACTAEWMRVLKPSGSMWVNLGDKYAGSAIPKGVTRGYDERTCPSCGRVFTSGRNKCHVCNVSTRMAPGRRGGGGPTEYVKGAPTKSLIGIPWRYALRCIDDLGLILRSEVIWSKPNGLPESVTDRVRRSHEQWFHFTLEPRYFSAVDEIREAHTAPTRTPGANAMGSRNVSIPRTSTGEWTEPNPLGKLPGSVWTVPTEPLRVPESLGIDHFAAYPTEFPRRIIQGWSPSGVCVECGEGRRPVATKEFQSLRGPQSGRRKWGVDMSGDSGGGTTVDPGVNLHTITGYTCACPDPTAPTTPSTVLDPFGGTGTTALVAHALGRHGISNDMSADYCRLAAWRTSDPGQIAKVRGERKPVEQIDGQADLFGEVSA